MPSWRAENACPVLPPGTRLSVRASGSCSCFPFVVIGRTAHCAERDGFEHDLYHPREVCRDARELAAPTFSPAFSTRTRKIYDGARIVQRQRATRLIRCFGRHATCSDTT